MGLGTDERHQAHLAATSQGGGGGRIHGLLQDFLEGEQRALSRNQSHLSALSLLGYVNCLIVLMFCWCEFYILSIFLGLFSNKLKLFFKQKKKQKTPRNLMSFQELHS